MPKNNQLTFRIQLMFSAITGKKAQELPGWAFIVGLILGLIALIFLIWLAVKGGKTTVGQLGELR